MQKLIYSNYQIRQYYRGSIDGATTSITLNTLCVCEESFITCNMLLTVVYCSKLRRYTTRHLFTRCLDILICKRNGMNKWIKPVEKKIWNFLIKYFIYLINFLNMFFYKEFFTFDLTIYLQKYLGILFLFYIKKNFHLTSLWKCDENRIFLFFTLFLYILR